MSTSQISISRVACTQSFFLRPFYSNGFSSCISLVVASVSSQFYVCFRSPRICEIFKYQQSIGCAHQGDHALDDKTSEKGGAEACGLHEMIKIFLGNFHAFSEGQGNGTSLRGSKTAQALQHALGNIWKILIHHEVDVLESLCAAAGPLHCQHSVSSAQGVAAAQAREPAVKEHTPLPAHTEPRRTEGG